MAWMAWMAWHGMDIYMYIWHGASKLGTGEGKFWQTIEKMSNWCLFLSCLLKTVKQNRKPQNPWCLLADKYSQATYQTLGWHLLLLQQGPLPAIAVPEEHDATAPSFLLLGASRVEPTTEYTAFPGIQTKTMHSLHLFWEPGQGYSSCLRKFSEFIGRKIRHSSLFPGP